MANKNNDLQEIETHHRVNNILLGPLERPALEWLAKHMPMWVTPDLLTTLGLLSAVLISASYYLSSFNRNYLWLANLGLFLNWFGDSLDGNLARYRHIERPHYGFFIDHTVDTISEVLVFIGIGLSPYVDLKLALLALVGYQCMANLVYITTSVKGNSRSPTHPWGPRKCARSESSSTRSSSLSAIPRSISPGEVLQCCSIT
jgi:phosphatidylglycerophosphate synthase